MCLSGVFLPWFCSGRVELYLGNISYLGRLNCRSTEETAAGGQGLVTAMVTLASGSGPAQMHVSGIQKASVESVALLDYFFLGVKLSCSNIVPTTTSC